MHLYKVALENGDVVFFHARDFDGAWTFAANSWARFILIQCD
jgi:phage pi2 protein 07